MTNEEAVKILRRIQEPEAWEPQINGAAFEALDMAIEALGRQQAAGSKDLISRQSLLAKYDEQHEGPPGRARKLIEDEPPALGTNLAEDGTDLISRAAAQTELQLSARRYTVAHEAHGEGRVVWSEDLISVSDAMDVLRKIPSAQPTFDARDTQYNLPIGTDLISRQQAIDTLENTKTAISENGERYIAKQNAIMRIDALPSAQPKLLQPWEVLVAQAVLPQPKRGRWHYSNGKPATIGRSFGVICDQCGKESEYCTNFCGECGADMRGVQDGTG